MVSRKYNFVYGVNITLCKIGIASMKSMIIGYKLSTKGGYGRL